MNLFNAIKRNIHISQYDMIILKYLKQILESSNHKHSYVPVTQALSITSQTPEPPPPPVW